MCFISKIANDFYQSVCSTKLINRQIFGLMMRAVYNVKCSNIIGIKWGGGQRYRFAPSKFMLKFRRAEINSISTDITERGCRRKKKGGSLYPSAVTTRGNWPSKHLPKYSSDCIVHPPPLIKSVQVTTMSNIIIMWIFIQTVL